MDSFNGLEIGSFLGGAIGGALAVFIFLMLFIMIALYIYISFVYMRIAQKGGFHTPGLAWIPFVGPSLISADLAEMDWWPTLFLIAIPLPIIGSLASIAWLVFMIIWTWKIFENFGRPGWWAVFWILQPVMLVFLGILAFSKNKWKGKSKQKKETEVKKVSKKSAKKKTGKKR